MSIWLKKRLAIWIGVSLCGALLWNVGALEAQEKVEVSVREALRMYEPRAKLSRDDAAKYFVRLLLDIERDNQFRYYSPYSEPRFHFDQHGINSPGLSSFSVKSEREFGRGLEPTLKLMASDWWLQQYSFNRQEVKSETEKAATVEVQIAPKLRTLILIEEDGGWGVDVFETYALWKGFQGEAKAAAKASFAAQTKELDLSAACDSNLKQIAVALRQYKEDHGDHLPPAESWMDALKPYVKSEEVFHCPAEPLTNKYGYAFNSELSDKSDLITSTTQGIVPVVAIYETTDSKRNAHGTGEERVFRHGNGANYAFSGSTRWYLKGFEPNFKLKP